MDPTSAPINFDRPGEQTNFYARVHLTTLFASYLQYEETKINENETEKGSNLGLPSLGISNATKIYSCLCK